MDAKRRLEEIFSRFPGIGPRQARRFVYFIVSRSSSTINEFIQSIQEIRRCSHECSRCKRFFIVGNGKKDTCDICNDKNREQDKLMIVARDFDLESIEKSGAYKGLYFVLGGVVPVLDKDPEKRIRLKALLERITDTKSLTEIILSLNTTPDGEHTETIVRDAIGRISGGRDLQLTVLGRGLSTGAELEYVDQETIRNALKNRQ